ESAFNDVFTANRSLQSAKWGDGFESRAAFSTSLQDFAATGNANGRVFAPYTIYKGKASVSISPVLPTFVKLDSDNGGLKVNRGGSIMLTFCPAIGERKYDWEQRQKFALSPTEVGSLISMGAHDASEFYHDPSMKSSNAGQVSKKLCIKAFDGGNGYMISLSKYSVLIAFFVLNFNVALFQSNFTFCCCCCYLFVCPRAGHYFQTICKKE
ncbi:hypothetical protein Golax_025191, partial [Gossypium laxum]|nr:hypothetical protein [Gossypium laxum]